MASLKKIKYYESDAKKRSYFGRIYSGYPLPFLCLPWKLVGRLFIHPERRFMKFHDAGLLLEPSTVYYCCVRRYQEIFSPLLQIQQTAAAQMTTVRPSSIASTRSLRNTFNNSINLTIHSNSKRIYTDQLKRVRGVTLGNRVRYRSHNAS